MSFVNRLTTSFDPHSARGSKILGQKTVWSKQVIVYTALLLISGTTNTIAFTVQSNVYGFKHGVVQTSLMFLGEYLNLFIVNILLVSFRTSKAGNLNEIG